MARLAVAIAFLAFVTAAASDQDASSAVDWKHMPNAKLQVNLVLRVLLAILGTGLCWPPLRALWRHRDTPGVTLIIVVGIMNLFTVLNSMIWSHDNWDDWWDGQGLCDIQIYLAMPLRTIYAATIFDIVYELSRKFDLRRAVVLSPQERRNRVWKQAAIIFVAPAIQLVTTYFITSQRYEIGTLIGCTAVYDDSWPTILLVDVPIPVYVVLAIPYTLYAYLRFRRYSKRSRLAIESNNASASRHIRLRRRLYNVTALIMLIYGPVSLFLLGENIRMAVNYPPTPYDFMRIHSNIQQYPWNSVIFTPSWSIDWLEMNQPWFSILTTVAIVAFFGTSEECSPVYCRYMTWLGLGWCFPSLRLQAASSPPEPEEDEHPDDLLRDGIELMEMGTGNGVVAE
ncbi:pheromone A receptor-domain-containing protein [Daldinia bambusicola]|nr:pheromone A receptor-domain-containing protein [Daldinia bambusicola]